MSDPNEDKNKKKIETEELKDEDLDDVPGAGKEKFVDYKDFVASERDDNIPIAKDDPTNLKIGTEDPDLKKK